MLKEILDPDLFHGHRKKKDFFEGWYFKIVDKKMENVFAFIPGLFLGKDSEESHSFLQLVHGRNTFYHYKRYPTEAFQAKRGSYSISIEKSSFSLASLSLRVDDPLFSVFGDLSFSSLLKWPATKTQPGSMGFFNYIPRMQCYSQVCAMDMELRGRLTIQGEEIDFTGGRGYVEKNWGRAFPYSWIWIQSNHFSRKRASLSCSLGHIPFLFTSFKGFLIGLYVEDIFYPFTTMNKSSILISSKGRDVLMEVKNREHALTIETETKEEDFILLTGPRSNKMIPLLYENLNGRVKVRLVSRERGEVLFDDEGVRSGIEYGGNQPQIIDESHPSSKEEGFKDLQEYFGEIVS